jgi:hypothetical protein
MSQIDTTGVQPRVGSEDIDPNIMAAAQRLPPAERNSFLAEYQAAIKEDHDDFEEFER